MTVQHVVKTSSNVTTAVVSQRHGFVTVGMTAETSRTNKTAVSNATRYTYFHLVFLIVSGTVNRDCLICHKTLLATDKRIKKIGECLAKCSYDLQCIERQVNHI